MEPALALLHAIVRRDLPAAQAALDAGAELQWRGIPALHVAALCDWPTPVPLLVEHGADVDAPLAASDTLLMRGGTEPAVARLQGMGVPADVCEAVLPLHPRKAALALAVRCGSAATAAALLAAGASAAGAFPQLVELARWKAEQLGPQAAATAVPALVQRCAEALFAATLQGEAVEEAHATAAKLAFSHTPPTMAELAALVRAERAGGLPEGLPGSISYPPCSWLLEQLLQQQRDGLVPQAGAGVWAACEALLVCVQQCKQPSASNAAAWSSALATWLAAWLRLPAASSIQDDRLARMLDQVCQHGLAAALPPLLALAPIQAQLRAQADRPLALGGSLAGSATELVCSAAFSGRAEVLDAVLAAGGAVTLNAVCNAATRFRDLRAPRALQLLLSRGRPPVPLDGAELPTDASSYPSKPSFLVCPIYAVLDRFPDAMQETFNAVVLDADANAVRPSEEPFHQLHARALATMDCLADAGYRPSTFTNYLKVVEGFWESEEEILLTYSPAAEQELAARWELDTCGRWLWLAARCEPWSPERHAAFPPAFKRAARALLLAAHRGGTLAGAASASSSAAQLGRLPRELLHAILGHAAYPVSPWRPVMVGGRVLKNVREWEPEYDSEPYHY